ncbi:hypothetical protein K491DRAFT_236354 [Lophiostoma macrostomum CBS 122681]|uniref:RapZ C-terminal domain-containing protein n=1 Tax=Lophiostoma macrostomum CBS 122681 TaxID=1314788 RepID=A0A6A6TGM5_9PLEO|nr:hypothetical protein K491DRAFT_236354 [Lophiostoma macrostomum CBS 122681]
MASDDLTDKDLALRLKRRASEASLSDDDGQVVDGKEKRQRKKLQLTNKKMAVDAEIAAIEAELAVMDADELGFVEMKKTPDPKTPAVPALPIPSKPRQTAQLEERLSSVRKDAMPAGPNSTDASNDIIHPLSIFPPFTIPRPLTPAPANAPRTLYITSFNTSLPATCSRLLGTQRSIPPSTTFLYTLSCVSWLAPQWELNKRGDGLDRRVQDQVMEDARARMNALALVNDVMACFFRGHADVSVLVGCNTGRWRSVAAVERVAKVVDGLGGRSRVRHAHL